MMIRIGKNLTIEGISNIHTRTLRETDPSNTEDESLKSQVIGPIWSEAGNATAVSVTIPHFNDVSGTESKFKRKTHNLRRNLS